MPTARNAMKWVLAAVLGLQGATLAQSPHKIDVNKMNPTDLLVDKQSYMNQPQSFYYFHHMGELGFQTDWVRRGDRVYPLSEPREGFSVQYNFHGSQYSLDDYSRGTSSPASWSCTTIRSCWKSTFTEPIGTPDSSLNRSASPSSRSWSAPR